MPRVGSSGARQVVDEAVFRRRREPADAHDRLGLLGTLRADDLGIELGDPARLGHFTLHLEPESLEILDRGQRLRLGEFAGECLALGILRGDHRVVGDGRKIAGNLAHDTEHFAQIAQLGIQGCLHFDQLLLVGVELRRKRVGAGVLLGELGLGLREHLSAAIALLLELGDTRLVLLRLARPRGTGLLEQLIERAGGHRRRRQQHRQDDCGRTHQALQSLAQHVTSPPWAR